MILTFQPPRDASLFDIVINTYGSIDLLGKFIRDNNITNLNGLTSGKEIFIYDFSFVKNYDEYLTVQESQFKYVTGQKLTTDARPEDNFLLAESGEILETEGGDFFLVD